MRPSLPAIVAIIAGLSVLLSLAASVTDGLPPVEAQAEAAANPLPVVQAQAVAGGSPDEVKWEDVVAPLSKLLDAPRVLQLLVALGLAALLAAVIAYHPWSYGKARSLEELESPKTYIMYAVVGAIAGRIALLGSVYAFVLFGIGGLMRFRTDVGAAKDTGRVILVTCVGLCCGLDIPHVGVLAAAFAFLLIIALERSSAYKLTVKGLAPEKLADAASTYRDLLENESCVVMSEKKSFLKNNIVFVFRAPREYDRDDFEQLFEEQVDESLRGAIDWQTS